MPDRFFLGVGTGENLNEHILGQGWPEIAIRQQRLAEAIEIMRLLWRGEQCSHHGKYYVVESARLYSLPKKPLQIMVAAAGPQSAKLAAKLGDGLIATEPNQQLIETFRTESKEVKPCYGELHVCFDPDQKRAEKLAHEIWSVAGLPGQLFSELPLPSLFEKAASLVSCDQIQRIIPCGPDPEKHLSAIQKYIAAGFDHIFIHQIGAHQEAFMEFYATKIFPRIKLQPKAA